MISRLALFTTFVFLALVGTAGAATFNDTEGLTATNSNSAGVANPGTPYPSTINAAGTVGAITDVDVTLSVESILAPAIFNFLLVAPDGTAVTLMTGAGGYTDSGQNFKLLFDQSASTVIPNAVVPFDGKTGQTLLYRPAGYRALSPWQFPGIAPTTDIQADLGRFNDGSANGPWRLYASGTYAEVPVALDLSGWSIDVKTAGDTVPPVFSRPAVSGKTIGFDLSEAAAVQFRLDRISKGVKVKSRCLAPKKGRKGKNCSRYAPLPGAISFAGVPGPNSFRWDGKIGSKKLAAGKYRFTGTANDAAGNQSSPQTFTVTIKKPKKPKKKN